MIFRAHFIKSLAKFDANESLNSSAIAFLGRSNVGKSSLINALCRQKNLAKSSSTPGKTRLINLFEVYFTQKSAFKELDEKFNLIFIDLPGFGYAKVSKDLKQDWDRNLNEYLEKESAIKLFVHLIDSRHSNLSIDKEINIYLKRLLKPDQNLLEVFTKVDKLNQSQRTLLKKSFPQALFVSSLQNKGLDELEKELVKQVFIHDQPFLER